MKRLFVTGIGTEIGKTVISAILTEALQADYWKPVQSGDLHQSDSMKIQSLTSFDVVIHPETYRLQTPVSPHYSAAIDGVEIEINKFQIPETDNHLIVEGAGGLHVPLNQEYLLIDLIQQLNIPVILVSQNYLGSINHSLLSIEALQSRKIPIEGIIFNGAETKSTETYLCSYTGIPCLGRIPVSSEVSQQFIKKQASAFNFS